jgi:secreted PhoX family phosphatase
MFLDADAGSSYERIRMTALKTQTKIDFPMVQTLWIDRIKGAIRVNADPRSGTVVGFIRGTSAYQVSLENESLGPNTRIVYFDQQGELTGRNYGDSGGGFLILNAPQGFRTVLIQRAGANAKAMATAVLVEDRVTNVINKTF